MWRVVLRALLEIRFRDDREHPEWSQAIISFYRNPSKEQFETRSGLRVALDTNTTAVIERGGQSDSTTTPSAKDIVMETLRLYPPTRRIYRVYQWAQNLSSDDPGTDDTTPAFIAADVEACHIRSDIWGPGAATFDPTRWVNPTREQREAFMPFGSKPFECPAKAVFGPRMIGTLLGALLVVLNGDEQRPNIAWVLKFSDDDLMKFTIDSKERLGLERDAFDDLELCGSWE